MQRTAAESDGSVEDTMELAPPPDRRVPARPVFVDASGRRQRSVRRIGRLLVLPAVAYVALLVSTLLGGPTIDSPYLPLPAAPQSTTAPAHHDGGTGAKTGMPSPGATGRATGAVNGTGTGTGRPGSGASGSASATSGAPGAPGAGLSASATPGRGRSTHQSAPPPGASHRPTKKA